MNNFSRIAPVLIATHDGAFHADDIVGVAILKRLYPFANVVRTRDADVIGKADFVVDVGGTYAPVHGRFDHHQPSFEMARPDGSAFASAGLVWKSHGEAYLLSLLGGGVHNGEHLTAARDAVDASLMRYLDRVDSGQEVACPGIFGLTALLDQFMPTTAERRTAASQEEVDLLLNQRFMQAVDLVSVLLERVARQALAAVEDRETLRGSTLACEGKVLMVNEPGLDWSSFVCEELPQVLYAVYPTSKGRFHVQTARVSMSSFEARKDLPEPWAGLRDAELAQVTGVPDAVFCHKGRFVAGADTLEGAMALARAALAA